MKNKLKKIGTILIVLLTTVIIIGADFYKKNFAEQNFEVLLYNLLNDHGKANYEIVLIGIKQCLWKVILLFTILYTPIYIKTSKKFLISIKFKKKKKDIKIYPFNKKKYMLIIFIFSIIFGLAKIGIFSYLTEQIFRTKIFDQEYINSKEVEISFPDKKRNLIYIFVESMEPSLASKEEGGAWEYTLIPELVNLANENIYFSNNEKLGGALSVHGTTWTIAGMVAQTAGIPLKVGANGNTYLGYSSFLPGAYTLGDILEKEGYNQEVIFGSDATFGGRKEYFQTHGNYKIFDYNTALEQGKMSEEDKVWWGFSDDDLFEWSKEEILKLASEEKPFDFILLTADTHFMDGYLSENADIIYDNQYENVFAYSSKIVCKFIKWIQEQDFYDNTTIVIVGDHIGMQTEFYENHIHDKDYTRTVYNVFINSAISAKNNKNRQFSTLDIFPTVLASMGAKIDGERLGLGTNLFSGKNTLIEEIGYKRFDKELSRRSNYYNKYLLGNDYIKLLNQTSQESNLLGGD